MEYFTLSNGNKMPMAGIGVFMMSPAEAEAAVESAIKSGVRLIDTANGYMNESGTGRGIKKSGVAREEIFLVTKLWPTVYEKETAIDETLARLGTDYIDLLFLHQPTDNWREGYRNIEKAYKEGKVKAIGLSNFPEDLLKEAIETMDIKPHVVQVEAHPYFPQTELKAFLAETGMGLMASLCLPNWRESTGKPMRKSSCAGTWRIAEKNAKEATPLQSPAMCRSVKKCCLSA